MSDCIGRISFIALNGDTPEELGLEPLPAESGVAEVVWDAFGPFEQVVSNAEIHEVGRPLRSPSVGVHLVYVFGHAWLDQDQPQVSIQTGSGSRTETATDFLARLLNGTDPGRTILILDCCHAATFDSYVAPYQLRLTVYGSGIDEKAIALHGDMATRLSLSLLKCLRRCKTSADLTGVLSIVAKEIVKDGVIRGQTVDWRMHGRNLVLTRSQAHVGRDRERSTGIIRRRLVAGGAVAALILGWMNWFYWSHTLIEVDLVDLGTIAGNIVILASEEEPESNERRVFSEKKPNGNRVRIWAPAGNVLIQVNSAYQDGQARAIAFHLSLQPGFSPSSKLLHLALPQASIVEEHSGMARVPPTPWYHGREREQRMNKEAFWIDIAPPTVEEYLPVAQSISEEDLGPKGSLLLDWLQTSSAVDAVGLDQLRTLNRDLGDIFAVIDSANSENVAGGGDLAAGLGDIPCGRCPAPMTRREAEIFCQLQGKRLPTDLEWELAVRGVDGRTFPWGNQFDETRANVPGLPDKGDEPPQLKPVDAYADERSPYGLVDTVGNAGDWVINTQGAYERVYMGATYRFNQEDATTFRMLPLTETDSLLKEITVRCVSEE